MMTRTAVSIMLLRFMLTMYLSPVRKADAGYQQNDYNNGYQNNNYNQAAPQNNYNNASSNNDLSIGRYGGF